VEGDPTEVKSADYRRHRISDDGFVLFPVKPFELESMMLEENSIPNDYIVPPVEGQALVNGKNEMMNIKNNTNKDASTISLKLPKKKKQEIAQNC
jgi:hypothetical protein